jgi:MFS superfamily sulfate permease-like transporter
VDVPSVDMLAELKEELEQRNTELWLARLHGPVRDALERSSVLQKIGKENIRPRSLECIVEYLSQETLGDPEDIAIVNDGLKMTLEVVEKLLSQPTGERREALEVYHQKLVEVLHATESYSSK